MSLSEDSVANKDILAVSTEDGRILFYSTIVTSNSKSTAPSSRPEIPICEAVGQLGGAAEGLTSRIKDFEILSQPDSQSMLVVTGSSDGAIRLWLLDQAELTDKSSVLEGSMENAYESPSDVGHVNANGVSTITQVGSLLGSYEAGNRITCLKAFVMSDPENYQAKGLANRDNVNRANGIERKDESNSSS